MDFAIGNTTVCVVQNNFSVRVCYGKANIALHEFDKLIHMASNRETLRNLEVFT